MLSQNLKVLSKYNTNLSDSVKNSKKLDWLQIQNNNSLIKVNNQTRMWSTTNKRMEANAEWEKLKTKFFNF